MNRIFAWLMWWPLGIYWLLWSCYNFDAEIPNGDFIDGVMLKLFLMIGLMVSGFFLEKWYRNK